jgi:acyl transferase domain-containing protein
VEVGPGSGLTGLVGANPVDDVRVRVPALREPSGDARSYLDALAALHVDGVPVVWQEIVGSSRAPLPGYAFARERYWVDAEVPGGGAVRPLARAATTESAGNTENARKARPSADPAPAVPVRELTALVLGHSDPEAVDEHQTFRELGVDSLGAVEQRDRIAEAVGTALPATLTYDHPTPHALAAHLSAYLAGDVPAAMAAGPVRSDPTEPVAIVGMACRLPGGIGSADELWRMVVAGEEAIGPFPTDRGWAGDGTGGFLTGAGDFDADFFGISPREALATDPQQRILLECAWEALERAGIDPLGLAGSDTGVYTGVMGQDYLPRLSEVADELRGHALTGAAAAVVAGRLAYVLGLQGPTLSVDTACSSSLVGIHLAVRALRGGECSLALAGGATVMSTPGMFTEFA